MNFKTAAEASEYVTLGVKNPGLYLLVKDLDEFCHESFGKAITLTEVFRDRAEMRRLYGKSNPKKAETGKSPHMFWNAVDLRERDFTKPEQARMVEWLKDYDKLNQLNVMTPAKSRTVWVHAIPGNVMHFHVQYRGPAVHHFTGMTITASR